MIFFVLRSGKTGLGCAEADSAQAFGDTKRRGVVSVALRTGRRNPSAETEQSSDENQEGTFLFQAVRFGFEPSREGAQRCLPSISLALGRVAPAETGFN